MHVLSASIEGYQRSIVVDQERMHGGSFERCVQARLRGRATTVLVFVASLDPIESANGGLKLLRIRHGTGWLNPRRRLIIVRRVRSIHTRCANVTSVIRSLMCRDDNTRPRLLFGVSVDDAQFVTSAE